jgi:HK97 family phage major capsid protein
MDVELINKSLGDLRESVESRIADSDKKAQERIDRLEAKLNRPGATASDAKDLERKAFDLFMRRGADRMGADEQKNLQVAVDSAGGFLAPPEFNSEMIKLLRQYNPIRQFARVMTIGAQEVKFPRRVDSTVAIWTDELDPKTSSTMTFEQVAIKPHELATYVDVSNQILEDNSYNLEAELSMDLAESFAIAEGQAFINGTGVGQPTGLLTAPGIASINSGSATGLATASTQASDILITMFHKLPGVHAQNGVWLMNRNTLSEIRKIKNSMGDYLVLDSVSGPTTSTLLGRPIVEAIDMPDIAANAYPVIFGDLSGYRIVDRIGMTMLRDPYTLATNGAVRFHARKRLGADLTHPDRLLKLKIAV